MASPKSQARHAVSQKLALGKSRHENRNDGKIHSLGTARNYTQALKGYATFIRDTTKNGSLQGVGKKVEMAMKYLEHRAERVGQKTLDQDRQAIQVHIERNLNRVKSGMQVHQGSRSYTPGQVERIAGAQTERYALATHIAYNAGLRAHELLTLRSIKERGASTHRQWSADRFQGRSGMKYTVEGKGGLIREVLISQRLSQQLESRRLSEPQAVIDRGIARQQYYNIGGGKLWSKSFSEASKRELGWSNGAHGVRHSYAQERMNELQRDGMNYLVAKEVVAHEVGHFDKETTSVYLR